MSEFVIKHYDADQRPILKGHGFDGLEIGNYRDEAEEFIEYVNSRIKHLEQQLEDKNKRIEELEKAICIYFREFILDGSYIIDMDEDADSKAIDNFIKLTSKYW